MCTNPARTFGFTGKRTLDPGTDADIILFDPNATYTISAADNASVADYSIYEGREVTGVSKRRWFATKLSTTTAQSSKPTTASSFRVIGRPGAFDGLTTAERAVPW